MGRLRLIIALGLVTFGAMLVASALWLVWRPLAMIVVGVVLVSVGLRMNVPDDGGAG